MHADRHERGCLHTGKFTDATASSACHRTDIMWPPHPPTLRKHSKDLLCWVAVDMPGMPCVGIPAAPGGCCCPGMLICGPIGPSPLMPPMGAPWGREAIPMPAVPAGGPPVRFCSAFIGSVEKNRTSQRKDTYALAHCNASRKPSLDESTVFLLSWIKIQHKLGRPRMLITLKLPLQINTRARFFTSMLY